MRLELHIVKIKNIRFGNTTGIQKGVLTILENPLEALQADVKEQTLFNHPT